MQDNNRNKNTIHESIINLIVRICNGNEFFFFFKFFVEAGYGAVKRDVHLKVGYGGIVLIFVT